MNWNDLQFLLAISRAGTLSAAAHELGVNQTTVSRRVKALETDLGSRLLDRDGREYKLTPAGEKAVEKASAISEMAQDLANEAGNNDHIISGTVRFSSTLGFISHFMTPRLHKFIEQHPHITLELVGVNQNLSLARRQADVSLRLNRPTANNTAVRKVGCMTFAVYGVKKFIGKDYCNDSNITWGIYDKEIAHVSEHQWFEKHVNNQPTIIVVNDSITLVNLVVQGIAIGILPCYVADQIPCLHKLSGDTPILSRELWLSTHRDIRHIVRIRKLIKWLSREIEGSELGLE